MLSGRTKQVNSYGRRGQRIVNVTRYSVRLDDDELRGKHDPFEIWQSSSSDASRKEVTSPVLLRASPTDDPTRSIFPGGKKAKRPPRVVKTGNAKAALPGRHPLGLVPTNTPGSPAVPPSKRKKRRSPIGRGTPLTSLSPFVDVDIVVLDEQGRRISQERRMSKRDVQINKSAAPARAEAFDATTEANAKNSSRKKNKLSQDGTIRSRPIIISSDESDVDEDSRPPVKLPSLNLSPEDDERPLLPPKLSGTNWRRDKIIISPELSPSSIQSTPLQPSIPTTSASPLPAPIFVAWTPKPVDITVATPAYLSPLVHRPKPRKLTPIKYRPGRTTLFPRPFSPASPTTPTDFDLSIDFSQLALTPSTRETVNELNAHGCPPPAYLVPLLEECAQATPHEFSAFIGMFPLDPIVHAESVIKAQAHFQKIGEASYSEVFGIGNVVLKVIPLRDEEAVGSKTSVEDDIESPAPSDARDVLKEIIVTRAMGKKCYGFVQLLRTYIVRGKYPSLLLDLWDEYNDKKGSESVRPDSFSVSQVYAIIVLPNGGPDLEAYTFERPSKTGWRQACSVFWQVTRTLAEAEDLVCFEHRDLHWGQILVKNLTPAVTPSKRSAVKVAMDDDVHGVEATIIDLGLARMDSTDDEDQTHWTPFDEEIFEGEGDYQFDVYRMMRLHNGDSWEEYHPLTNIMWLHYLSIKLLHAKRLRPPPTPRKGATMSVPSFTERECYECLVEIEEVLGRCVATCKPPPIARKSRRKTQAPTKPVAPSGPKSAADLLRLAVGRGWVR